MKACRKCKGLGLIPLPGANAITYAWQAFFTMRPCENCQRGNDLVATFEDGKREYGELWRGAEVQRMSERAAQQSRRSA